MSQQAYAQMPEKKPPVMARRATKRRMARDLVGGAHQVICDQFEARGADSDIDIAEAFETQRPSVVSILVYELYRRCRRSESRVVELVQRLASMERRLGMQGTDRNVARMLGRTA